jgi:hypothetical protein
MPKTPVAVAETTLFQRTAGKILSDDAIDELMSSKRLVEFARSDGVCRAMANAAALG